MHRRTGGRDTNEESCRVVLGEVTFAGAVNRSDLHSLHHEAIYEITVKQGENLRAVKSKYFPPLFQFSIHNGSV
jgi:hypothetical protein